MIPATAAGVVLAIDVTIEGHGVEQEIVAAHPAAVPEISEVNRNVKQPVGFAGDAVTVPGPIVPVYVPSEGAAVELPSKMYKKSQLFSRLKLVKLNTMSAPGVEGQNV